MCTFYFFFSLSRTHISKCKFVCVRQCIYLGKREGGKWTETETERERRRERDGEREREREREREIELSEIVLVLRSSIV